jgi:trans-AT polyketide synthase/acyltransferase/oxidoreductase domain-containing protein
MTTAWLFPGQGSQREEMGRGLVERYPDLTRQANEVLNAPLATLASGTDPRLRETEYLQPVLFAICVLAYHAAVDAGEQPDVVAGHSLGEYAALYAAGSLNFADGLRLVRRRGELMARCRGGRMLAVVGLDETGVHQVLTDEAANDVDVANRNGERQFVLSGPDGTLRLLRDRFTAAGATKCVPLAVSVAAHSRYLAYAATLFARDLADVSFAPPRIPVVSNGEVLTGSRTLAASLAANLSAPVDWTASMSRLRTMGVDRVREIGPGHVLTRLWQAYPAAHI